MPKIRVEDPWAPSTRWVPRAVLGSGAIHDFSWYLDGATSVQPKNVDELCAWLAQCTYASDPDVFHEPDFWQHPRTFEQLRKGDCEDFALWAWRKLLELGLDAQMYIGRIVTDGWRTRHAWVVFTKDGERLLMEPSRREQTILPFATAKDRYEPYFFVGRDCKPTACEGHIYYLQRRDGPVQPPGKRPN